MARRRTPLSRLLAAYRRPLLLAAGLFLIVVGAFLLPPIASRVAGLESLDLFPSEPEIRVLLHRLKGGDGVQVGELPYRIVSATGSPRAGAAGRLTFDGKRARLRGRALTLPTRLLPKTNDGIRIGSHRYLGVVSLVREENTLAIVGRFPLEDYVAGVIACEMGLHFPEEALRAQSIAARTYAVPRMRRRSGHLWHVRATQAAQVYRGVPAGVDRAQRIVRSTRGVVLAWEDALLDAVYSSTCGGTTRPAGEAFGGDTIPPLQGVPCGHCDDAPLFRWTARIPVARVLRELSLPGTDLVIRSRRFHDSERLRDATIDAGDRRVLTAARLRRLVGKQARSPWIRDVFVSGRTLVVKGRGFGHGVGLCQYGARGLAERRRTGEEILARYYPGARRVLAWSP